MIEDPQLPTGFASQDDLPSEGFVADLGASFTAQRKTSNIGSRFGLVSEEYDSQIAAIERDIGVRLPHPLKDRIDSVEAENFVNFAAFTGVQGASGDLQRARRRANIDFFEKEVARLREENPDIASLYDDASRQARVNEVAQNLRARAGEANLPTRLAGSILGGFTDPVTLATAPIGGSSKTILGAFAKEALANAAVETALTPVFLQQERDFGNEAGLREGFENVALAGLTGGALGGSIKGGEKLVRSVWPSRSEQIDFGRDHENPEYRAGAYEHEADIEVEALVHDVLDGGDVDPVASVQTRNAIEALSRLYGDDPAAATDFRRYVEDTDNVVRLIEDRSKPVSRETSIGDIPQLTSREKESARRKADRELRKVQEDNRIKANSLLTSLQAKPKPALKERGAPGGDGAPVKSDEDVGISEIEHVDVDPETAFDDADPRSPAHRRQVQELAARVDALSDDAEFQITDGVDAQGNDVTRSLSKADLAEEIRNSRVAAERLRGCLI